MLAFPSLSGKAHTQPCINKVLVLSCGFHTPTMCLTSYWNIISRDQIFEATERHLMRVFVIGRRVTG